MADRTVGGQEILLDAFEQTRRTYVLVVVVVVVVVFTVVVDFFFCLGRLLLSPAVCTYAAVRNGGLRAAFLSTPTQTNSKKGYILAT